MAQGLRRTSLACALAVAIAASANGCAGEPFTSTSDSGAAGNGVPATGGVGVAGASNAGSGGRTASGGVAAGGSPKGGSGGAQAGSGASAGVAQGGGSSSGAGSGGSAEGGTGGAQAGSSASGGNLATGGAPLIPDIPTNGLVLWLAADRGVTLTNGAVSKWLDQSPTHADAIQVASASRPKQVVAENGLPLLEFDGDDDSLALPDGFADFSAGLTFFAVAQVLKDAECVSVMQFANGVEEDDINFGRFQGSIHYEVAEEYANGQQDAFAIGPLTLLDFVHDADESIELRIDSQIMATTSFSLPRVASRAANFVGRSLYAECSPFDGRVAEILFYSRPFGTAERILVEQYLSKKWGCCAL